MNIFKISIISLVLFSQSIIIARSQTEIVYNENHCPDITSLYSTHPDRPFRYGYPLNYFNLSIDYQNQLLAYGIQKGDKVAEIGAASGWILGMFAIYTDSVSYFAQDIDTNHLNENELSKMATYFSNQKSGPQTNSFNYVIGTPTQTNLPEQYFDVIFIDNSYHEFTDKEAMIKDIKTKLKPDGRLIISELITNDYFTFRHEGCNILANSEQEIKELMEKNGLYQTNSWLPDGNVYNHLTFEMNQQKSLEFLKGKRRFPELIQLSDEKLMKNQEFVDTLGAKLYELRYEIEDYYSEEAICDYFMSLGVEFAENKLYDLAYKVFYVGAQMYPDVSYFYDAQAGICTIKRIKNVDILKLLNDANEYSGDFFYTSNSMNIKSFMAYYLAEEGRNYEAFEILHAAIVEADGYQGKVPNEAINAQKAISYDLLAAILSRNEINEEVLYDFDFLQITPLEAIDMAIKLDSLNPDYYVKRAQMFYENELYEKAKNDLDRIIYLSPYNPIYFKNRGKINKILGDVEGSEKDKEMYKSLKKWRRQMGITD